MKALMWWSLLAVGRLMRSVHMAPPNRVLVEDPYTDEDRIIDLGGGGEGVIGQVRRAQVTAVDLRQGELDEAPDGPIKVVADARELPFSDGEFDAATAFYFLMYVASSDRETVLEEAHRVLRLGATLRIWDATIPAPRPRGAKTFMVPVCAKLPGRTIRTLYGVAWKEREMSASSIAETSRKVGFDVARSEESEGGFFLELVKSPASAS